VGNDVNLLGNLDPLVPDRHCSPEVQDIRLVVNEQSFGIEEARAPSLDLVILEPEMAGFLADVKKDWWRGVAPGDDSRGHC
jgi:hypothetical protein